MNEATQTEQATVSLAVHMACVSALVEREEALKATVARLRAQEAKTRHELEDVLDGFTPGTLSVVALATMLAKRYGDAVDGLTAQRNNARAKADRLSEEHLAMGEALTEIAEIITGAPDIDFCDSDDLDALMHDTRDLARVLECSEGENLLSVARTLMKSLAKQDKELRVAKLNARVVELIRKRIPKQGPVDNAAYLRIVEQAQRETGWPDAMEDTTHG